MERTSLNPPEPNFEPTSISSGSIGIEVGYIRSDSLYSCQKYVARGWQKILLVKRTRGRVRVKRIVL